MGVDGREKPLAACEKQAPRAESRGSLPRLLPLLLRADETSASFQTRVRRRLCTLDEQAQDLDGRSSGVGALSVHS